MDEKQFKELVAKLGGTIDEKAVAAVKVEMENFKNDLMTSDQFKEKMDAIAETNDISGMKTSIEEMAVNIKKLREAGPQKKASLRDMLVEKHDTLKALKAGSKSHSLELEVKTNVLRSSITDGTTALRLTDIGQLAHRGLVMADLFRPATIGKGAGGSIRYTDQKATTNNAATISEAGEFPESVITWQEYNLSIEKIGDTIPVSQEMLDDVDWVDNEIRKLLEINCSIVEDTQLYSGDGNTPNYYGVQSSATAFAETTPKKDDMSIYDLIRSVKTKMTSQKESKYMPDYCLMNETDIDVMQSKKDANFNYVQPPWVSQNGMLIGGVQIVSSPVVTAGEMLMGDFRFGTYYRSDAYTVELGFVASQFKYDLMTLKARKRGALLIRNVDKDAFWKVTDIDAAIAALLA